MSLDPNMNYKQRDAMLAVAFGAPTMTTPDHEARVDREWATANNIPVLRLTGEQIDSIEPPLDTDYWFIDFDEYELFVPLRTLRALATDTAPLDTDDRAFLRWCHERFAVVFRESPNLDWMQRLARLTETP